MKEKATVVQFHNHRDSSRMMGATSKTKQDEGREGQALSPLRTCKKIVAQASVIVGDKEERHVLFIPHLSYIACLPARKQKGEGECRSRSTPLNGGAACWSVLFFIHKERDERDERKDSNKVGWL